MKILLSTRGLCRNFGPIKALDMVDLDLHEGEVHGLFGANGAGKSTFIRVVTGIIPPVSGSIDLMGIDVVSDPVGSREYATTIVEIPKLYQNMNLYELLRFYCQFSGMEDSAVDDRILEAVDITGCSDIAFKKFGKMSLGQQHRAEVARAIATARNILFMDEPFIGIDITTKMNLKRFFSEWVRNEPDRAVLFTSHNLLENEGFVNRLSFIENGRIVESNRIDHFRRKYLKPRYSIEVDDVAGGIIALQNMNGIRIEKFEGDIIFIEISGDARVMDVNLRLAEREIGVLQMTRIGSMEDVFTAVSEVKV
ncbi:MAG: ABC transporter ATP-binding protein [Thermoplasmatota archaeon]